MSFWVSDGGQEIVVVVAVAGGIKGEMGDTNLILKEMRADLTQVPKVGLCLRRYLRLLRDTLCNSRLIT